MVRSLLVLIAFNYQRVWNKRTFKKCSIIYAFSFCWPILPS